MHLCLKKGRLIFIFSAALKPYDECLLIQTQHLLICPLLQAVMIIEIVGYSSAVPHSTLLFN